MQTGKYFLKKGIDMETLNTTRENSIVTVKKILAEKPLKEKLLVWGIFSGTKILVMKKTKDYTLVVVGGKKIVLDREVGKQIIVVRSTD